MATTKFDVKAFQLKGKAASAHCNLLKIDWSRIKTADAGWKEYNALKDKAHKGVNAGCKHVLAGKTKEAKGAFAYAWQCRSVCDWMFPPLREWKPNSKDPDGKKHKHAAKTFENLARALCSNKDGTPKANVPRATYEKFAKPFTH